MVIRLIKKYNTGVKDLMSGFEFEVTNSKGLEMIKKGIAIQVGNNVKANVEIVDEVIEQPKEKKEKKNSNKVVNK